MNVLVVFGTRPEAIKLAPVIAELRRRPGFDVRVATTAQHRELLDQVLTVFSIVPDVDLDVMRPGQTLAALSGRVLAAVDPLLLEHRPDVVVVQGDTTSAFMCALAAFYRGVPVVHVEAGLRSGSMSNPFPEEANRRLTAVVAALHFAPTEGAREALLAEGVAPERVFVTGNTVVDALLQIRSSEMFRAARARVAVDGRRQLLVTLHRRESFGAPLRAMCEALKTIASSREDVHVVIPVHLNPSVRAMVHQQLTDAPRVSLLEPLDYVDFVAAMDSSWLVLTDSGGVQEEAPALGCPVLVLRETTERMEGIEAGAARLIGTSAGAIVSTTLHLLDHPDERDRMARPVSPFGDGHASERIAGILENSRSQLTREQTPSSGRRVS